MIFIIITVSDKHENLKSPRGGTKTGAFLYLISRHHCKCSQKMKEKILFTELLRFSTTTPKLYRVKYR